MTDEAKRIVEALRWSHLHDDCSDNAYICPVAHECARSDRNLCDPAVAADLIESLFNKNKQLEYTLVGVMHFVDKWLDDIEPYSLVDDPSGQIAIDRAAEARRITLEHIEDLTREMYRRGQEISQVQKEKNAAVEDIRKAAWCVCHVCKHHYRPNLDVQEYACKILGSYDEENNFADGGSIFCGSFEWRGIKGSEN